MECVIKWFTIVLAMLAVVVALTCCESKKPVSSATSEAVFTPEDLDSITAESPATPRENVPSPASARASASLLERMLASPEDFHKKKIEIKNRFAIIRLQGEQLKLTRRFLPEDFQDLAIFTLMNLEATAVGHHLILLGMSEKQAADFGNQVTGTLHLKGKFYLIEGRAPAGKPFHMNFIAVSKIVKFTRN